jgi:hypothetical protein
MPSKACVFKWLSTHKEFADHYARAREAQADSMFEEIDAVSGQEPKTSRMFDKDGNVISEHTDSGDVQHRRLRVDALKWMAGKLRPKKYGDVATLQADVTHKHYVAMIPQRTTNDPMEWARQVHAERIASGDLPPGTPFVASVDTTAEVEQAEKPDGR